MVMPALGRLMRVDLRSTWKNEASDFTPWLARAENLALLAEALGLPEDSFELQGHEQAVGPFRADILCRNTEDDTFVLIENQLERTDHNHLGQLLTYAAGLKAVTLIWIAERFTDEHRATLDWLNDITDDGCNLFGLEIELWQIGNSPPAPKFNIVVQPNEWTRTLQKATRNASATTPVGQMQVGYWTSFGDYLVEQNAPFRRPKPYPSNWMNWGLGRAGIHLEARVNSGHIVVGIEIKSHENPEWFQALYAHKARVETEMELHARWEEKPNHKHSSIRCSIKLDMYDESNWETAHQWHLEHLLKFDRAFRPLVKSIDELCVAEDIDS